MEATALPAEPQPLPKVLNNKKFLMQIISVFGDVLVAMYKLNDLTIQHINQQVDEGDLRSQLMFISIFRHGYLKGLKSLYMH